MIEKRYAKKGAVVRAVRWLGKTTAEILEVVGKEPTRAIDGRGHDLGNGWYVKIGDWVVSTPDEKIIVVNDETFQQSYEEVDERRQLPPVEERAAERAAESTTEGARAERAAESARVEVPAIFELREMLARAGASLDVLTSMLDELAQYRATAGLRAEPSPAADLDDLPPDGATGLYLDHPLGAEDLEWVKMAWDALLRGGTAAPRPMQLMLVFQTIRRDERATGEFLRVMNTIVLPLLRRLRLSSQPELSRLGGASE